MLSTKNLEWFQICSSTHLTLEPSPLVPFIISRSLLFSNIASSHFDFLDKCYLSSFHWIDFQWMCKGHVGDHIWVSRQGSTNHGHDDFFNKGFFKALSCENWPSSWDRLGIDMCLWYEGIWTTCQTSLIFNLVFNVSATLNKEIQIQQPNW